MKNRPWHKCQGRFFILLLHFFKEFAFTSVLIELLKFKLSLYLFLVLAGKEDVTRGAFYFYEVYL